jgi:adhesin/invasin
MKGSASKASGPDRDGMRMKHIACCLMLVTTATGCHRPGDYPLSPSRADEVLSLTVSSATLPADGIARVTITAQLDPQTDADKRNVTFTTTAGTLIAVGKEGLSITETADANGKAVVELRSSTIPATARLVVTVGSVARTASVEFLLLKREEVFDVSVSRTSVPADEFSTTTITVTLKRLGTLEQRAIKFETTLGTLIAPGLPSGRVETITANAAGTAVVELQSEKFTGTARVRVTALDISHEFDISFTPLAAEDVFDVSVSRQSIQADGFSTTTITVTLKRPGTAQQRVARFETSAGTLIVPGQAGSRAVTVPADAASRAVAELQSDKTVGTARVRVTVLDISEEFDIAFTAVNPAQIITVSVEPSSGPADGVTPLLVTATVVAGLPAGRRTVAFRTSLGQLLPLAVDADGSNMARATLVSTTPGVARITATVDGSTAETTAQFTAAQPDRVFVAPDAVALKSGDSTTIRVTLIRATGSVSPRLEVSYSATTDSGAAIGSFSRVTLAENSVSTASFNVGTTTFRGPVTIRATVEGGATGTATVQIVP